MRKAAKLFATGVMLLLALGTGAIVFDEMKSSHFSPSANPELSAFIGAVVAEQHPAPGNFIRDVSQIVCPTVSREEMDKLVSMPGTLKIRTVPNFDKSVGVGMGYYIRPRFRITDGWHWLLRPGLQVELYSSGRCFAAVRRWDAI